VLVVPSFLAAAAIVGETDYVATLPKSLVLRFGQTFGIRVLTPSAPRVSVAVKLAWHERTQHDAAMKAFRDLVATAVRASRKATRSPSTRKYRKH
jgi:DNA-binding transcriptional LysR family regulator